MGGPWGLRGGSVSIALAVASRSSIARTLHKSIFTQDSTFWICCREFDCSPTVWFRPTFFTRSYFFVMPGLFF